MSLTMPRRGRAADEEKDDEGDTQAAKISKDLIRKIKFICEKRKSRDGKRVEINDYIDPILRPVVDVEYEAELKRELAELQKKPSK